MVTNISSHDADTDLQRRVNKTRERLQGFGIGFAMVVDQATREAFKNTSIAGRFESVLFIIILILDVYLLNRVWVIQFLYRYAQAQADHSSTLRRTLWWLFAGFAFPPLVMASLSLLHSNRAIPYPPALILLDLPSMMFLLLTGFELCAFYHPSKIKPVTKRPDLA